MNASLFCLKYFLFFLQDLINSLLPKVLPAIIEGLQDLDDDVRAVAAASLVPVVESLVHLQSQKVNGMWVLSAFFTLDLNRRATLIVWCTLSSCVTLLLVVNSVPLLILLRCLLFLIHYGMLFWSWMI